MDSAQTVEGTAHEVEQQPARELVVREPGSSVLKPLDVREVKDAMDSYQRGLQGLLDDSDYQTTGERNPDGTPKKFVKKSGWRKIATWFGLSVELGEPQVAYDDDGQPLRVSVVARAVAPNGRVMEGDGHCSRSEFKGRRANDPKSLNNMIGTATTRAKNRAISDLVGMGDVSAEEVSDSDTTPAAPATPDAGVAASDKLKQTTDRALDYLFDGLPQAAQLKAQFGLDLSANAQVDYMPQSAAQAIVLIAKTLRDAAEPTTTAPQGQEDTPDGSSDTDTGTGAGAGDADAAGAADTGSDA